MCDSGFFGVVCEYLGASARVYGPFYTKEAAENWLNQMTDLDYTERTDVIQLESTPETMKNVVLFDELLPYPDLGGGVPAEIPE